MSDIIDLLQIKIEKAKAELPEDTQNAINAVDWKAVVLGMREKRGYSFEQLGDLEIETELLLCGLVSSENYSTELEKRMRLSKAEANDLIKEMNDRVFAKIKENLIKNIERKKTFAKQSSVNETEEEKKNTQILSSAGIEILSGNISTPAPASGTSEPEKPILTSLPPILTEKLSGSFQVPITKTDHTLNNLTPSNTPNASPTKPVVDPYREIPE